MSPCTAQNANGEQMADHNPSWHQMMHTLGFLTVNPALVRTAEHAAEAGIDKNTVEPNDGKDTMAVHTNWQC